MSAWVAFGFVWILAAGIGLRWLHIASYAKGERQGRINERVDRVKARHKRRGQMRIVRGSGDDVA